MLPQEKKNQDFFHGVLNISSLFAKQFQQTYVLSFLTFYCHYLHIAARTNKDYYSQIRLWFSST